MRGETGYSLWVLQQRVVVSCCPGGQVLTVRRCCAVAPVDMLAVEVASVQSGNVGMPLVRVTTVEVCRRQNSYILQRLRTTIQYLIVLETDRPVSIPTAREQTWQGRDSCSGLTQLVQSWESLACQKLGDIEHVRGPC